jgi:hypothetical protein
MAQENKNGPTPSEAAKVLALLEQLAEKFNTEAAQNKDTAKALAAAAGLIRAQQTESQNLREELKASEKTWDALSQAKPLTVFVDGTGSMIDLFTYSPLQRAIDALTKLSNAGMAVRPLLWGWAKPVPMTLTKEDFTKASSLSNIRLSSIVEYVKEAESSRQHCVIVNDGDLINHHDNAAKMRELLKNPKITLDFVVMYERRHIADPWQAPMQNFAEALQQEFPHQVSCQVLSAGQDLASALKLIAAQRGAGLPKGQPSNPNKNGNNPSL